LLRSIRVPHDYFAVDGHGFTAPGAPSLPIAIGKPVLTEALATEIPLPDLNPLQVLPGMADEVRELSGTVEGAHAMLSQAIRGSGPRPKVALFVPPDLQQRGQPGVEADGVSAKLQVQIHIPALPLLAGKIDERPERTTLLQQVEELVIEGTMVVHI